MNRTFAVNSMITYDDTMTLFAQCRERRISVSKMINEILHAAAPAVSKALTLGESWADIQTELLIPKPKTVGKLQ